MLGDPNDVIAFTRVVEAGSFTKAARAEGVPTSTVSRRVARLEEKLGVRLLHRTTRRLTLTDAGRILHDRGARILSELSDAERAVTEMQATPRGLLRLTAPAGMGEEVAALVVEFLRRYAEIEMEVLLTDRRVDLIEEGVDVALRAGPLTDSTLVAHKLREAPVNLVASPAYLKRRGTPRHYKDLERHDCVLFTQWSPGSTWSLDCPDGKVKVRVHGRVRANSVDVVSRATLAGLGIAFFPARTPHGKHVAAGRLRVVLPEVGLPPQTLWIVYPSRRHLAPKVRAFVDFAKQRFARTDR